MTVPFSPFFDGSQENQGGLWGGIASMFVPKPNPEEEVAKAKDAGKLAVAAERHQVDISDPDSAQELATQIGVEATEKTVQMAQEMLQIPETQAEAGADD